MSKTLRLLIREIASPVGDSVAEVISDIEEVVEVLNGIAEISPPRVKMLVIDAIKCLGPSIASDGRKISATLSDVLRLVKDTKEIKASGLVLRLETLLRRSLPISAKYDTPQSSLKPPFDPTKSGRYITIV
jgi:hypothetical protein